MTTESCMSPHAAPTQNGGVRVAPKTAIPGESSPVLTIAHSGWRRAGKPPHVVSRRTSERRAAGGDVQDDNPHEPTAGPQEPHPAQHLARWLGDDRLAGDP